MALSTKAVKGRIKSVKNTKKITKAMEMIAAVKMRKAVAAAKQSREYAHEVEKLLQALSRTTIKHPLAQHRKVKHKILVIITSDRGLCGSYNSRVIKHAAQTISNTSSNITTEIMALGRKGAEFARRHEIPMKSMFEKLSETPDTKTIHPIAKTLMHSFTNGEADEVDVIYTKHISGMKQEVRTMRLLPITKTYHKIEQFNDDVEFEPTKTEILNNALPMLTEVRIYQALLESIASEHSSRMIAMKNATDAAGELQDELQLEYNKARQAAITKEIAEISAGADALT